MTQVFSTPAQLGQIALILSRYIRLPVSTDVIPGAFMESVLAHVRGGQVLRTYDYIDVHHPELRIGWSVKSTKSTTPLTWKRAKIANKQELIRASLTSAEGLQEIGDSIIEFCNAHARASIELYGLDEIGYARLIVTPSGSVRYFERLLCTREQPNIFKPDDFEWRWSVQKTTVLKEQLQSLHGFHRKTGRKWWAWHGLGENQLHFSGEGEWWPMADDPHAMAFQFPSNDEKLSFDRLLELLEAM